MRKRLLLVIVVSGLLTACGNKGPLVLPDAAPADAAPSAEQAVAPADTASEPAATTP